jgi:hypothetical protein
MLVLVLLIIAAVCFAIAALNVVVGRVNVLAVGLLAWVLAALIPRLT